MKTLGIAIWTVLLCGLGLAGKAVADDEDGGISLSGPYLSLGPTYTTSAIEGMVEVIFDDAFAIPLDLDLDDSWGLNARVGYRFTRFFAAEVQYEWIDEFDYHFSSSGVDLGGASTEGHTFTLNGKLIAPIWRIQPYLLLGLGFSVYDFEDSTPFNALGGSGTHVAFAGRAGIGIDFHFTDHISVYSEGSVLATTRDFEEPDTGDYDDYYYLGITVGLQYRF